MERTIQFDRQSLYERVWQEPLSTLCRAFGISDVGLKKICKKLNVPTPGRGYWAKHQVGKAPPRPPLLNQLGPVSLRSCPEKHQCRKQSLLSLKAAIREIKEQEEGMSARIAVAPRGALLSALAVRLEARLDDIKLQCDSTTLGASEAAAAFPPRSWRRLAGGLVDPGPGYLAVATSPVSWERALTLADAFICGMRDRGFEVRVNADRTVFQRGGFEMYFRLTEVVVRRGNRRGSARSASGRLRLTLRASDPQQTPHAISFYDRPSAALEDQLNLAAIRLRCAAAVWEQRLRDAKETQRVAAERAFFEEVEHWTVLQHRRAFLNALGSEAARRALPDDVRAQLDTWLTWAHGVCARDDPLELRLSRLLRERNV